MNIQLHLSIPGSPLIEVRRPNAQRFAYLTQRFANLTRLSANLIRLFSLSFTLFIKKLLWVNRVFGLWVFIIPLFLLSFATFAKEPTQIYFYSDSAPPLVQLNEQNQPEGAIVELAEEIIKRSKLSGTIKVFPWSRANQEIKHKANSFLLIAVKTTARNDYLKWIGKLYEFEINLLHLKSRPELKIQSLEQAKTSLNVAVRDYAAGNYLQQSGFEEGENLILTSDPDSAWHLLFKGRADYAALSLLMSRNRIRNLGYDAELLQSTLLLNAPSMSNELYLATGHNTSQEVIQKVTDAFNAIKADGSYEKMLTKWGL